MEKIHSCPDCDKGYKTKRGFINHRIKKHDDSAEQAEALFRGEVLTKIVEISQDLGLYDEHIDVKEPPSVPRMNRHRLKNHIFRIPRK